VQIQQSHNAEEAVCEEWVWAVWADDLVDQEAWVDDREAMAVDYSEDDHNSKKMTTNAERTKCGTNAVANKQDRNQLAKWLKN